jgi:phosphoglycerate dehydrogenase-like enzyme
MRDGTWLINTARGWLVDPDALEKELVSGRLNAYIDTSTPEPLPEDSPLYGLPNVVLTPHIAGAQGNELVRMADLAVSEIERYARGMPPLYPVTVDDLTRVA